MPSSIAAAPAHIGTEQRSEMNDTSAHAIHKMHRGPQHCRQSVALRAPEGGR